MKRRRVHSIRVRLSPRYKRLIVVLLKFGMPLGLLCVVIWMLGRPCTVLDIRGMSQADSTSIMRLAMPADSAADAALVADRVRRHPWVRWSTATCYPSRVMQLSLEERIPVLLVIDAAGAPAHFIDPAGFMMPVTPRSTFDVPLLRNFDEPYHPLRPVEHPQVRTLAQALTRLDAGTERLVSEFVVTPSGLTAYTVPADSRGPVEVWLGRREYAPRLQWLRSFWDQRVASEPEQTIYMIDLRFRGQIVTREEPS